MAIAVVGMHRSGTSMVTRMLAGCGLQVGPDHELLGATPENPTGHWERRSMVLVDDAVLDCLGLAWDFVPAPPSGDWLRDPGLLPLHEEARQIVASFPQGHTWGWKDPRATLILPFWEEAIGEAATLVVCARNPLDVAASLGRRGGMSQRLGLKLWHTYMDAALDFARTRRHVVTHYDAYFEDARTELTRVCQAIGLTPSEDDLAAAAAGAERAHRHSSRGLADLVGSSAPDDTVALYVELLSQAGTVMDAVAARDAIVFEAEDEEFDRAGTAAWVAAFRADQLNDRAPA